MLHMIQTWQKCTYFKGFGMAEAKWLTHAPSNAALGTTFTYMY